MAGSWLYILAYNAILSYLSKWHKHGRHPVNGTYAEIMVS